MGVTILKEWKEKPELIIQRENSFHYARELGIEGLFPENEPDWEGLKRYWKEGVFIRRDTPLEHREVILGFNQRELESDLRTGHPLRGSKFDSFTLQAQTKGICKNLNYLATLIYGVTISSDGNSILWAERAQTDAGDLLSITTGSVAFAEPGHVLETSFLKESNEEAGILPEESADLRLLGVYRQDSSKPTNVFLYRNQLTVDLDEVVTRHENAMRIYNEARDQMEGNGDVAQEIHARKALKRMRDKIPTFPKDAWENSKLVVLPNDPDALIRKLKHTLENNRLRHGMFGALPIFFRSEYGDEAADKLLQSYNFPENVKYLDE